ncbi:hypothetical protein FQR65_LT04900 [Abscondita terminalis]|nr:hypothetical protein FQR65_LT04900 [Abscondita terminalis]
MSICHSQKIQLGLMCPVCLKSDTEPISFNSIYKVAIFPFNNILFSGIDFLVDLLKESLPTRKVKEEAPPRQKVKLAAIAQEKKTLLREKPVSDKNVTDKLTKAKDITPLPCCSDISKAKKENHHARTLVGDLPEDDEEPLFDDDSDMDIDEDTEDAECMNFSQRRKVDKVHQML